MLRSTLLALVLALSACGVSPSDYYARLAASYCEELARCGGIGESEQLRCEVVQNARSARSLAELEEAVGAGRLAIDAGALSRCLNAAETSSCSAPRRDCSSAFVGRVKAGGACRNTGECTVGACEVAKGRCFGLCRAPTGAAVGQPCSDTHPCLVDRTCFNGVCGHLAMVGQYCGDYKDCMPSLSCIDSRCRAAGKDVDPCTGFLCEAPLFCDSGATPPTCKAHAPLPGPSEPCAWSQECRKGYACTARRELPGQCLSWLDAGQSCDPATSRCPRSMCRSTRNNYSVGYFG